MQPVIRFENVGKLYRLGTVGTGTITHDLRRWWITNVRHKEDPYLKIGETNDRSTKGSSDYVYALKDINLEVQEGDVLGIIGKNGAGKSTLLKLLSRVTAPTTGKIYTRGRIASLLEVGTGFHPELTGRENIYMNGSILGMKKNEINRKLDEIIEFSGCERYIDTPVKRYSSGMMVRLGFAVAAHLDPEILVVDEVLAVGDAEFLKKAIGKMQDVSKGQGRTVLFVSHNMGSVRQLCNTGIILDDGMISYIGSTEECVGLYLSEINATALEPITCRIDRKGTGEVVLNQIKITDTNNKPLDSVMSGQDFIIKLHYKSYIQKEISNIIFSIEIKDDKYNPVSLIHNRLTGQSIYIKEDGVIECFIKHNPLNEGKYLLSFSITQGGHGDYYDLVENAYSLIVKNGDFYISGELPPSYFGPLLIDAIFIKQTT